MAIGGITRALAARVRTDGSRPLLTHYDLASGARIELSATSFANWCDKTVGLLGEEGEAPGDPVALPVVAERPGHWVSAVWVIAAWQAGCPVLIDPDARAALIALGPRAAAGPAPASTAAVVACSLHPLGTGFAPGELPATMIDFADVRQQPDGHVAEPWPTSGPAWREPDRELSFAEVAELTPDDARRLVVASRPWPSLAPLLAAILGGGSVVMLDGDATPEIAARIAAEERVSA